MFEVSLTSSTSITQTVRRLPSALFLLTIKMPALKLTFFVDSEDYVHRIGRTGRAGQVGTAITLFTADNSKQARDLVTVLTEAKQQIDPALAQMARSGGFGGGGRSWGGRGRGGGGGGRGGGGSGGKLKPGVIKCYGF